MTDYGYIHRIFALVFSAIFVATVLYILYFAASWLF
jgi:hypothetical protein